jgi:hypothetical protein
MLGPAPEHKRADEEVAAEDIAGDLLAVIQLPMWSRIRTAGQDHTVGQDHTGLPVAAENSGPARPRALIRQASRGRAPRRPGNAEVSLLEIAASPLAARAWRGSQRPLRPPGTGAPIDCRPSYGPSHLAAPAVHAKAPETRKRWPAPKRGRFIPPRGRPGHGDDPTSLPRARQALFSAVVHTGCVVPQPDSS